MNDSIPPGYPGIPPRWTSSAKSGIGAAINAQSRIWFTISHGILDEVYYDYSEYAADPVGSDCEKATRVGWGKWRISTK